MADLQRTTRQGGSYLGIFWGETVFMNFVDVSGGGNPRKFLMQVLRMITTVSLLQVIHWPNLIELVYFISQIPRSVSFIKVNQA